MKVIELNTVHYVNWKGIILTLENPRIEATEENLEKLKEYLKANYVKVREFNGKTIEIKMEKPVVEVPVIEEKSEEITVTISREPLYSQEELDKKNKEQLFEIADKLNIECNKNISLKKLKEEILNKIAL